MLRVVRTHGNLQNFSYFRERENILQSIGESNFMLPLYLYVLLKTYYLSLLDFWTHYTCYVFLYGISFLKEFNI